MNTIAFPRHFVCARVDALEGYIARAQRDYAGYMPVESLTEYLHAVCPQFLLSMGCVMDKKLPVTDNTFIRMQRKLSDIKGLPYFGNAELSIDNGGYQIQQGFLPAPKIVPFIRNFYDFISHPGLPIDWSFTLDIAPGSANVFDSERMVRALNEESYRLASELDPGVRSKIIYVEHFRTRALLRIWNGLRESGYPLQFSQFATGGLASSPRCRTPLPCIPFAIPLARILIDAKDAPGSSLRFHVLGNSQLQQFLAYSLIEEHVRTVHGIDLHIVCDSTALFSGFMRSARLPLIDVISRTMAPISLCSDSLSLSSPLGGSNAEAFIDAVQRCLVPAGLAPIPPELIYVRGKKGEQLSSIASMYGLLLYLNSILVVEEWSHAAAADLYPIFSAGDDESFIRDAGTFLRRLAPIGDGIVAQRNATRLAEEILGSLRFISNLDIDYGTHIVDRYLDRQPA